MKLRLIENWKDCWRFASVQMAVLLGLLDVAYDYLPAIQTHLPPHWVQIMAVVIIAARVIQQKKRNTAR